MVTQSHGSKASGYDCQTAKYSSYRLNLVCPICIGRLGFLFLTISFNKYEWGVRVKDFNFKIMVIFIVFLLCSGTILATVLLQGKLARSADVDEYFTDPIEIVTHLKFDDVNRKLIHIKAVIVVGAGGSETYQVLSQNPAKIKEICINFFNDLTEKQVNELMKENLLKDMLQMKINNSLNVKTTGVYFQEILIN